MPSQTHSQTTLDRSKKVDDDYTAFRIRQWAKTVVVLSTSCVPQLELDGHSEFNLPEDAL
jgi:hypothetical protein